MATRKNKLTTVFDGDDRPFQKKVKRVQSAAKKTGAVISKMGGLLAGIGISAGMTRTVNYFDRIGKIATRMNMSAESLQKLSVAADLSGASIEQLQGIMTRLERRTGEALQNSTGTQAQRFAELNIEVEAFSKLSPEDKIMGIADAFNALGGTEQSIASLMGLLDTEIRELLPLLKLGSEGINDLTRDVQTLTGEQVKQMEAANDAITRMQQATTVKLGQSFIGMEKLFSSIGAAFRRPDLDVTLKDPDYWKQGGVSLEQSKSIMRANSYNSLFQTPENRRLMERHNTGDLRIAREKETARIEKEKQKNEAKRLEQRQNIKDFSGFKQKLGGLLRSRFKTDKLKEVFAPHKIGNLKESAMGFAQDVGGLGRKLYENNKERNRFDVLDNMGIFAGDVGRGASNQGGQTSGKFGQFVAAASLGGGRGRSVSQSRGIRIQGLDKSVLIQEAMKKALESLVENTTEK
ncbi:MAG: hypothetical protein CL524_00070 [Aequorivita sp.]|nr:hypothetical protein [Aequorivita sp.]